MNATYTYDHYYQYQEITDILKGYEEKYPEFCRLSSIGTTSEGRNIWLMEVTDLSKGTFEDKPGFAIDGNVHAGEVTGSMCCMYFLDYLFTNLEDQEVKWILEHYTVYCVPRITPDGSECYLTTPTQLRSVNKMFPFEELQPGVQPQDLDGDGVIRQMRVRNDSGAFKKSELDPRIMIKRRPDEVCGEFYDVFSEGMVNGLEEGEELKPAPDKFGNDFNRNFAAGWGIGGRGGAYGFSNIETKAFGDYLYKHPNICHCLNFHTSGGVYIYPPAMKDPKTAPKADIARFKEMGVMVTEETGYPFVSLYSEFLGPAIAPVGGSIDDFCYSILGFISYTCECWDLDARCGFQRAYPPKPVSDKDKEALFAARLKWLEENVNGEGFMDWKEFDHPQLGKVEIGGLDFKHTIQNPPSAFLLQEVEKHTRYLLRAVKMLPRLSLSAVSVKEMAAGLYEVKVKVANTAYLPTYITDEGRKINFVKPITAEFSGVEVVSGKASQEIGFLSGYAGTVNYNYGPASTIAHEPNSKVLTYVVKGEKGQKAVFTCQSPRSGKVSLEITL